MIKFPYYIVCKLIKDSDGNELPVFIHCVSINGIFYKITSLETYLKTGAGVSDEIVEYYNSYVRIDKKFPALNFSF